MARTQGKVGSDPRELPAYGLLEASHYLRIPSATLRSWVKGRLYPTEKGPRKFQPLLRLPDSSMPSLSFMNLVEAHVLDAIRREHKIPMHKVRKALTYVEKHFPSKHPLADQKFETDGLNLFISVFDKFVDITQEGQLALKECLAAHLKRIDRDPRGVAVRLYPFTRRGELDEPKNIVIDPFVSFGRPIIIGTSIPTSVIAERYKAGDSMDSLADDYGCGREQIEEAVRCELSLAA